MNKSDYRLIEELGTRYAAAIDERDYEAFARCFAADGIWAVSAGPQKGHEAIAAYAERAVGHLAGTHHVTTNFLIDMSEGTATMRSTFIATHLGSGDYQGQQYVVGGVYKDDVVNNGGRWEFSRREIVPAWATGDIEMLRLR